MIYNYINETDYRYCNNNCDSTEFVEFMLGIIKNALKEASIDLTKVAIEKEKVAIENKKVAIQDNIDKINGKSQKNIQTLFDAFGVEKVFGRKDISDVCNLSYSAAGKIIVKLKEYELIEEVKGRGKGKYKFSLAFIASV